MKEGMIITTEKEIVTHNVLTLKRVALTVPLPSWRALCNALSHLDQSLSESISAQHQCECSLCTGVMTKIFFILILFSMQVCLILISKTREMIQYSYYCE